MPITHAGDRFENPATRETGRIVTGAADTEGRYMQSETRVAASRSPTPVAGRA